jgi:hypothetical protein
LNTAPELIGKICAFFMYILYEDLLAFQKQITVYIKLQATNYRLFNGALLHVLSSGWKTSVCG